MSTSTSWTTSSGASFPCRCAVRSPVHRSTSTAAAQASRFADEVTIIDAVEGAGAEGPSLSRLWQPLLDGAERVGVVGVTVPGPPDELLTARCHALATVIAELVITKTPYNDGLAMLRRRRRMSLSAEMRWDTLPPLTWTSERVAISGLLEPAYDVAGDTFDYSINGSRIDFALFDAVGHDLEAARIADLAVITYRNSRRDGDELQDLYRAIDRTIAQHVGNAAFATGDLATLDMDTGELRWVNAGHPAPMLLRHDSAVVDLDSDPNMPLGLGNDPREPTSFQLEPDDRVLFFTDGMIEARSPSGEQFGRGRLAELFARAAAEGLSHPETTRRLTHAILDHQGAALQDDATIVLLAWNGPPEGELDTPTARAAG